MGSGKGGGSDIFSVCSKAILVITNLIVFLLGLVLFAAGIALKYAHVYLQPYVNLLLKNVPSIGTGASLASSNSAPGAASIDLALYTSGLSTGLIIIGLIVGVVAILGMCGICASSKMMLYIYAGFLILLLIIQIAIIVVIAVGVFNTHIKDQMKGLIQREYGGIDKFDPSSIVLNILMLQFKCCGVYDYKDFNQASKWVSTRSVKITTPVVATVTRLLVTPIACCKMNGPFPQGKPIDSLCAIIPTNVNSNWKKGCYAEISSFILTNYKTLFIGCICGVLFFELLLIIMAMYIANLIPNKNNVQPA